jgi:hypothetical protein
MIESFLVLFFKKERLARGVGGAAARKQKQARGVGGAAARKKRESASF